jgi:transcriptional regulator with XRE-family HTH domain
MLIKLVTKSSTEIDSVATGANVRKARRKVNMSLRELARRMDYSAPYVSDLELGRRNWTPGTFDFAAKLINNYKP